jgi:hypothetical protein
VNVATRLQYGFGRSSSIRVNLRIPARPVVVAWCEIILASAVKVWFLGLLMGLAMLGLAVLVLVAAVADPYELAVLMLRVWAVGLGLWTVAEFAWSVVQNARGSCPQCGALPNIPRAEEGPCAA